MIRGSILVLSGALLANCTPKEGDNFGGEGTPYQEDVDTAVTGDTADSGTDTASDWPAPQDEDGPSQRNPDCSFDDFPGIGEVIYCEVEIRDAQDNVHGGTLELTIVGGDFETPTSGDFAVGDLDLDPNCSACLNGDILSFAISGVDNVDSYELNWTVKDAGGNRSNELTYSI